MSVRNLRERAAHLYHHPEDATHDDIRALVVMSEALRDCRAGAVEDRYVVLSLWSKDGKAPELMISDALSTDEQVMDTAAGVLARLGLRTKEAP